ncbi:MULTISPECIES: glycosyltransferase [unclassified Sphingomonas]|uniref:glycosyltransferase n=1 Tax=unclassified Sphingomonas TaxID=196159 RepID=UPI0006F6E45C|nr:MULTISPECIES: glycosyltransferase [unclassified Sphingomonas]KQX20908.1 group 1 glycosyl transferase [Sphingomonas sp. Root1294]KQY68755.1 group 1 glycosyl transferase [Sphingomonas sp. Root50]KRB88161.1 group 1 glycosyl transferase [Sphingomonas sp. Root720]
MGNIIIYVHDLRSSGVVRDAMMLADHCAGRHDTTLVAGHGEGFFREAAGQGRYRLAILKDRPSPAASRITAAQPLRRWLRGQPPGVLLSMGNHGHATAYLACRGLGHVGRVYRISNEVTRGDGLRGALRMHWMERLIADAARIAIVGATLRRAPMLARAIERGHAVEIPSGVDVDQARALALAPSPHPWFDEDVPVVLGIGRLRPQKNFALLIEAVGAARAERRLRLAILGSGSGSGSGDERARLEDCAARAGLGEDFLLAGESANVFAWAARAGVFVLPSRWEGSSVALLEAMAVGAPVIASRRAGDAAQVLDEGRHGLLVGGEDRSELARAILVQLSGYAVRPGDRACAYGLPGGTYLDLVEAVMAEMAEMDGPARAAA